ncbi:phosphoglycerate dehydrogenase [Candidatus Aerophobetes bacterium]|nr:phosphoglycerate dehydrogenase [Candidatus Aerophobetes bacterium]
MSIRVLVTSTSFGKVVKEPVELLNNQGYEIIWNKLGRPLKEEEVIGRIKGIDAYIAGLDEITTRAIEAADRLKVISKYGAGVDNIDIEVATRKKIVVTNTPGTNTGAVADLTFGLILAVARKIPQANGSTKKGEWKKFFGRAVYEKTLGIVGMGEIGKAVAKRAKGFNMRIIYWSRRRKLDIEERTGAKYTDLKSLLQEADFVSLHLALTSDTKNIIGKDEIRLMKPTAFLINTARGPIVNEDALYECLRDRIIAGAAVDAYSNQPPKDSPLLSLDNIIATPHMGAYTYESIMNMGMTSVKNVIDVLNKKRPEYVVNPEVYES